MSLSHLSKLITCRVVCVMLIMTVSEWGRGRGWVHLEIVKFSHLCAIH